MEKEDHAHDLARLGVAHQNKVEVLTLQHQKQVGQLQDQLSVLQQEHEESQLQAHVEETSRIGNRETMELEEKTGGEGSYVMFHIRFFCSCKVLKYSISMEGSCTR